MNFGGHLITGWLISKSGSFNLPERRFITLMGIIPDIDAFSMLYPPLLGDWHRTFGHNMFFALSVPFLAFLFFKPARARVILPFAFFAIASHFILDLLVTGWWALYPLWPFDKNFSILTSLYIPENVMKYYFQIGLFVILVFIAGMIYRKQKVTPLEIITPAFDRFIMNFVTLPFMHKCDVCGARAFYQCDNSGKYLCGRHASFGGFVMVRCKEKK